MIKELTATEYKKLRDSGEDHQLIDVREPYERNIASIGGENIPLGQLQTRVDEISREKKVIVYCRSGARSGDAVARLQSQLNMENLYNLKGGILAWSDEIDGSLQKY